MTTFKAIGLDLDNDAKPGAVTPVRLTIWRGRPGRPYAVKSVVVQVSYDGFSWQSVPDAGSGTNWLARVKDPAGGFVALRSIVTDVSGDQTTETVYRVS